MTPEINENYYEEIFKCLEFIASLPEGKSLTSVLGNGDENDDTEALRTWAIKQIMECEQTLTPRDMATNLALKLKVEIEETDIPPIIIQVEPHDDLTGPDYAFIGDRGLLTDLWELHEPGHPEFVSPYEWVSHLPDLKLYELLFLVCGEDGYWILIHEDLVPYIHA